MIYSQTTPISGVYYNDEKIGKIYKGSTKVYEYTGLPSAYSQLDYLASSGTQYIDTGFSPNQDSRMVLDFQPLVNEAKIFAGCRVGNATTRAFTINSGNSASARTFYFAIDGSGNVNVGVFNLNRHVADLNKTSFLFDGVEKTTPEIEDFTAQNTIYLFACNNRDTGSVNLQASCRIYSCKIYDNGVLVRDFIPCQRKSDDEYGMYDLVTKVFCTNQGEGDLIPPT